jgi:hypothetical protein
MMIRKIVTLMILDLAVFSAFRISWRHNNPKTPSTGRTAQVERNSIPRFGTFIARNRPIPKVKE